MQKVVTVSQARVQYHAAITDYLEARKIHSDQTEERKAKMNQARTVFRSAAIDG